MSRERIVDAIEKNRSFLITAHVNPEGDAIGSALALALSLEQMGKKAEVVNRDPLPRQLQFLPAGSLFAQRDEVPEGRDVLFVVDCGDLGRTGFCNGRRPPVKLLINIDHHMTNKNFGDINWIEEKACATAELIYDLICVLPVTMTPDIALCLYTSILSETGSFRYSNTTPRALRIAAELIEEGVDPWMVARKLYECNSLARLRLLGELLLGIHKTPDGRVAWIVVTQELYRKTETSAEDTEDAVAYPRSLEGVEVALLFREIGQNSFKISLRSRGRVNVAEIAARFGGGGHAYAAGCTVSGSLEGVQKTVVDAVEEGIRHAISGSGLERDE